MSEDDPRGAIAEHAQTHSENMPPVEPPAPLDPSMPPPPPPPEPIRSDTDSSDDDDGQQPWHPIPEDTSSPNENELKEIEAGVEVSALDHEHWERKAFEHPDLAAALKDPEHRPGATGRIEWTVENYNGTREKPNKELVMKSPPVIIGGHEWQIKFYPKGNDSDYLSVYVECLSVRNSPTQDDPKEDDETASDKTADETTDETASDEKTSHDTNTSSAAPSPEVCEVQHTPIPLHSMYPVPKRKSVAAQVSVVMYNPSEPRVNHFRTCVHRFCTLSPDWGWTRYSQGPYYDIPHRTPHQRQAMLRNDKLAFTAYVQMVEDDTDCLWELPSRDNPWDSFAMTGLQSLMLEQEPQRDRAPGGNMISAIASWMLFKPFRKFLYRFDVPGPKLERPKPLIAALQVVLFMLRTQVKPGAGPVPLEDVVDALEWYGIHDPRKLDVMEIWEVLRLKLEDELESTPWHNILYEFFGPERDYSLGCPSYRVPVIGVGSMQGAIDKATDFLSPSQDLPQLLTIELDRQHFDVATRSYVKLMNQVTLDEQIVTRQTTYTLLGCIIHKQTLQSYVYHPVLRPEGPGSRWYTYTDAKEGNMVKCLTNREAVDDHQGKAGSGKTIGNDPVAYIALYVRADVSQSAFENDYDDEQWDVPQWILDEVKNHQLPILPPIPPGALDLPPVVSSTPSSMSLPPPPPPPGNVSITSSKTEAGSEPSPPKAYDFSVIDSKVYMQHEGPGIFDAYDPRWLSADSGLVYNVQLNDADNPEEIRQKLAEVVPGVSDVRQIKFWFLDTVEGSISRPNLLGTGPMECGNGRVRVAPLREWMGLGMLMPSRIWVHVLDVADLPELPKEKPKALEPTPIPQAEASGTGAPAIGLDFIPGPPPVVPDTQTEDHPMSDSDEPLPPPPEVSSPGPGVLPPEMPPRDAQSPNHHDGQEPNDTAMEVEVDVAVGETPVPDLPAVDVQTPPTAAPADAWMAGTEDIPPPPPPVAFPSEPVPSHETAVREVPPPDEIYFFLKFFDAEAQTLESRGSHVALKSAKVDSTVLSKLGLPGDQKIELVEEEDLTIVRPIRLRRSFTSNDLHNTAVIIATLPLTEEKRDQIAARAAFADIHSFLSFRALARNFPSRLSGHFTYNYFSAQSYKGEIKNGHRHGMGQRIYHSGATYVGAFRLGQRHGHGLYTFQNGDTYDGEWVANQQHGTGTFVEAATGNTYTGGWRNDKKFGEGVTHWKVAQETERLCRICWEESAEAAFYDCGHVVACLGCARQVQNCPVCRKRVLSAMKLYYVA